jgi:hypothetical protein
MAEPLKIKTGLDYTLGKNMTGFDLSKIAPIDKTSIDLSKMVRDMEFIKKGPIYKKYLEDVAKAAEAKAKEEAKTKEETKTTEVKAAEVKATEKVGAEKNRLEKEQRLQSFFDKYQGLLKQDKRNQIVDSLIQNGITVGEMINNNNQELPTGVRVPGLTPTITAPKIDNTTQNNAISMSTNAVIKQLRDNGMSYLIPSVVANANNQRAEYNAQIATQQAQVDLQADQSNQSTINQRQQLELQAALQNEQNRIAQEQAKSAALSQNLTNLRNESRIQIGAKQGNSENQMKLDLMRLIHDYPGLASSLSLLFGGRKA